jgi:hypothetical protein
VIVDAHVHVFRPADVSPRGIDALAPAQRDAPAASGCRCFDGGAVGAHPGRVRAASFPRWSNSAATSSERGYVSQSPVPRSARAATRFPSTAQSSGLQPCSSP